MNDMPEGEVRRRPETGLWRTKVEPERIELPSETFKPTESAKFAMSCMFYDLLNSKIVLLSATLSATLLALSMAKDIVNCRQFFEH
jgi:hypothetical protein